jgi:hypothetical protein
MIGLYLPTHNTQQETDIHAPGGIRNHIPSKRADADPRLRPSGIFDWRLAYIAGLNFLA